MWNHRDEELFQRRSKVYLTQEGGHPNPLPPKTWKKFYPRKATFDDGEGVYNLS